MIEFGIVRFPSSNLSIDRSEVGPLYCVACTRICLLICIGLHHRKTFLFSAHPCPALPCPRQSSSSAVALPFLDFTRRFLGHPLSFSLSTSPPPQNAKQKRKLHIMMSTYLNQLFTFHRLYSAEIQKSYSIQHSNKDVPYVSKFLSCIKCYVGDGLCMSGQSS